MQTIQGLRMPPEARQWIVTVALAFAALIVLAGCSQSGESQYADDWGPSIGTTAPLLAATDQAGNQQDLATLSRQNGLLFVFNRSIDW